MNRFRQWISILLFQLCDVGSMYEQIKTMDFYCFFFQLCGIGSIYEQIDTMDFYCFIAAV